MSFLGWLTGNDSRERANRAENEAQQARQDALQQEQALHNERVERARVDEQLRQEQAAREQLEQQRRQEEERRRQEEEEWLRRERAAPWRILERLWDQDEHDQLISDTERYVPCSSEVGVVRMLLCGQIKAGKSSFINTLRCVFLQQIVHDAYIEDRDASVTKKLRTFKFQRQRMGRELNFELLDTMGMELQHDGGMLLEDVRNILDGHVPDNYPFNPAHAITEDAAGYIKQPTLREKIHVLVIVVDGATIQAVDQAASVRLEQIKIMAVERNIRWALIVNKVDTISPNLTQSVENIYKDVDLKDIIEHCANFFGIRQTDILPMKNYKEETNVQLDKDILALTSLNHLLVLADSTLEAQRIIATRNPPPLKADNWYTGIDGTFQEDEKSRLKQNIIDYDIRDPIRILLVGEHNAGKSSFVNTVLSALHGCKSRKARVQPNQQDVITKQYNIYKIKSARHGPDSIDLKLQLCDTMGFTDNGGMRVDDVGILLDGRVFNGCQINPSECIQEAPQAQNRIHALALVVDGSSIESLSESMITKLKAAYEAAMERGLAVGVLFTHIDKMCPHVQMNTEHVCRSASVEMGLTYVSDRLRLPSTDIFPIRNYDKELLTEASMDILALHAIHEIMSMAEERMEEDPEDRMLVDEHEYAVNW